MYNQKKKKKELENKGSITSKSSIEHESGKFKPCKPSKNNLVMNSYIPLTHEF